MRCYILHVLYVWRRIDFKNQLTHACSIVDLGLGEFVDLEFRTLERRVKFQEFLGFSRA